MPAVPQPETQPKGVSAKAMIHPHLILGEHVDGTDARSICGKDVLRAVAIRLNEGELVISFPPATCKKCIAGYAASGKHVLALVVNGEDFEQTRRES